MGKEYMRGYNLGYDDGKRVGLLEAYLKMLSGYEKGELQFSIETLGWIKKELEGGKE